MRAILLSAGLALALLGPAHAAEPAGSVIDFSVDAQRNAPNDQARATVYFEAQDTQPAELARRVNSTLSAALASVAKYPAIKSKSGETNTWPVYGKNNRIDGWRMRSSVLLESRDIPALSELLGKLQGTLMVGELQLQSAPETRKAAEDEALRDALTAFRARARVIADSLGADFRIVELHVQSGGRGPVMYAMMARAASPGAEPPPPPIAAGESTVSVTVSGKIQLTR